MARRRSAPVAVGMTTVVGIDYGFGGREPVAPERFLKSQSDSNIDWPGMVAHGENDRGITMQTPNGTNHGPGSRGSNINDWGNRANSTRWSGGLDWSRNGGNRSGE